MLPNVTKLGEVGIVADVEGHELPLNAWTSGRNVRFTSRGVEKFLGYSQIASAPPIAPYGLLPAQIGANYFWLLPGLAKVYAFDGTNYTNVTRQTAAVDVDYTASADIPWTGGVLSGVPVLNNGVDVPQMWSPAGVGQKLTPLTAWNSAWRAKVLRPYKDFLVALDVTKSGTNHPYMVKWSHRADTGAVPASWDETDPTKDAGEFDLADTDGQLVDCLRLRDSNIIYKNDSVYMMQPTANAFIFRFPRIFESQGALATSCVAEIPNSRHVVFGVNDCFIHDGQNAQSILTNRWRQKLYSSLNQDSYHHSFVAPNPARSEVWICYPESGRTWPNKALVWNWDQNTLGARDLPNVARLRPGIVTAAGPDTTWDGSALDWNTAPQVWGDRLRNVTKARLHGVCPLTSKFHVYDYLNQEDGVDQNCFVERVGLGVPFNTDEPPDITSMKLLRNIWPKVKGTTGGVIQFTVGVQDRVDGPITWGTAKNFTIGTDLKVDVLMAGRLFALRVSSSTDIQWALSSYDVDVVKLGDN